MSLDVILGNLASQGVLGVVCIISFYFGYVNYVALIREKDARIADARQLTEIALRIQEQATSHMEKMTALFEEFKKARGLR